MADWDVIIVGAGPSGLGVGALLSNAGKKVLVLEKERHFGGRAHSITHKGHIVEQTPHGFPREGNWEEIFARLGKPFPKVTAVSPTQLYQDGKWIGLLDLVDRKQLRKVMAEIASCSYEELERYDDIPLKDWVSARASNEGMHLFFHVLGVGAYAGARYESYSAGETLFFIKEQLDKFGGLRGTYGWCEGGYSSLTHPLYQVIREKGGEVSTSRRVLNIIIEKGQARGVEVEAGEELVPSHVVDTEVIRAPLVVCTLPLWDLFNVLNREDLPGWYGDWVEGIKKRVNICAVVSMGLDKPLEGFDEAFSGLVLPEYTRSGMVMTPTIIPGYGAPGEYYFGAWWMGNYDDCPVDVFELNKAQIRGELKKLFQSFEADLKDIFHDLEKQVQWREYHIGTGALACMPGLVGKGRPTMQIPAVANLYLVSDTIREGRGCFSQAAARAALTSVDRILGRE